MPKRFTLIEAERLLPEIEAIIRDAIACKNQYQEAEEALHSFAQRVAMQGGVIALPTAVVRRSSTPQLTALLPGMLSARR